MGIRVSEIPYGEDTLRSTTSACAMEAGTLDAWKCLFKDEAGRFVDYVVIDEENGTEAKRKSLKAYAGRDAAARHGAEVWRGGCRVAVID